MKIAFYAPLKSPRHRKPSGDRLVARLFEKAVADAGFELELASEFRTWEGRGNGSTQQLLRDRAEAIAKRLATTYAGRADRPDVWFTYHVYHKAPDWIGPIVCSRLSIPYVIAEASLAPRQARGSWRIGHAQCLAAMQAADAVISVNRRDDTCLEGLLKSSCELVKLSPFLCLDGIEAIRPSRPSIARRWNAPAAPRWLVSVAMMREGDKLSSYRQLHDVMAELEGEDWHLFIVGDGPARSRVEEWFARHAARTTFTGALPREEIFSLLRSSDLYVWPSVNEAYGMALLEAQACGLPVAACAVGGVPQIVEHGATGLLAPRDDTRALGRDVQRLIRDPALARDMGARARDKCAREHDIRDVTARLSRLFSRLGAGAR